MKFVITTIILMSLVISDAMADHRGIPGYGYYGPNPWYHRPADPPGVFGPRRYNYYPPPGDVPYYQEYPRYRNHRNHRNHQGITCFWSSRGWTSCSGWFGIHN